MHLWIKINIFIETFIFCFELISEQITSKLFYLFIEVVGRNDIHNQLDLLNIRFWVRNSCLYKLSLFLQGILFFSIPRLKEESLIIVGLVLILLFMVRFCSSLWEIIIFNLFALMKVLVVIIITVLLFPCLIIISSSLLFLTSSLPHFQIFFAVDFSIQH